MSVGLGRFIPFLFVSCALSGCSSIKPVSDKATCEQTDWYEIGRRDGSQGSPTDRLTQHQKQCDKQFKNDWETMYTNGRNAGLVEYCEPQNGYELGRMGIAYYYVCPSTIEPQFLSGYRRGQQARDLEQQNQKLDEQIDQTAQKLIRAGNPNEQDELAKQLDELKKTRAKNEQELGKIISK
jgi:hypothetical protein